MSFVRTILVLALGVSMLVTSAPATPALVPATEAGDHSCCQGGKSSKPDQDPDPCHNHSCVMQCCRLLPVQGETRTILEQTFQIVRAPLLAPVTLHSLAEPEAIFHPPKV